MCLSLKTASQLQDNKVDDSRRIESSSTSLRNKCKRLRRVAKSEALPKNKYVDGGADACVEDEMKRRG